MTTNLKAIYENGVLKLTEPLPIPEGAHVDVTVTLEEADNGKHPHHDEVSAYPTNERERAWIEAHREEYIDQWVALDGGRLVAHGVDARKVYEDARQQGVTSPYLERISPKQPALIGGWQ